jgi:hypothetical protein
MVSATPITPEQRGRTNGQWVQQDTDLTRLFGSAALPLTLLAQRTGAATVDAGCIDHAQTPICLSASLMRRQLLGSWTAERAIRLEGKVLAGEAASFPGQAHLGRSIARKRSCVPGQAG